MKVGSLVFRFVEYYSNFKIRNLRVEPLPFRLAIFPLVPVVLYVLPVHRKYFGNVPVTTAVLITTKVCFDVYTHTYIDA